MTNHESWYIELTDNAPRTPAAAKAGISQSTLHNQMHRGRLGIETVLALARAYGRNPVVALLETGYLDPTEVDGGQSIVDRTLRLQQVPDKQLIGEFMRRINANPDAWGFMIGDEPPVDSNGNVTPIRPVVDDDLPAVADSSPDHPEEDIEFDD